MIDAPPLQSLLEPEAPAANLRGSAAGAAWTYLLPEQRMGRVLVVGQPSQPTLARLLQIADEVDLVRAGGPIGRATAIQGDHPGLRVLASLREAHEAYDLRVTTLGVPNGLVPAGAARLRWREQRFIRLPQSAPAAVVRSADELVVRITPWIGEARTAVPIGDPLTARHFRSAGLEDAWLRRSLAARGVPHAYRIARLVGVGGRPARRFVRHGRLGGLPGPDPTRLPAYLRTLEPELMERCRWGLAARGAYASQKVLFYLYEGGSLPDAIIKLTSEPRVFPLIERAWRGLRALDEAGATARGRVPQAIAFGRPDGIVAAVERIVDGRPFAAESLGTVDCPIARDAVEGLIEIGELTRGRVAASAVAAALGTIVERFVGLYEPSPAVRAALDEAISTVAREPGPITTVGVHGDAGRQNLVVNRLGRVTFLDWENWEPVGLPLWDVVHFLRSYAIWATRRSRPVSRLDAVRVQFVDGGPLTPFIAGAMADAARRLDVPDRLIGPLVLTSWASQAVREASRLEPDRRSSGQFVRTLELVAAALDGPVTGRILGRDAIGSGARAGSGSER